MFQKRAQGGHEEAFDDERDEEAGEQHPDKFAGNKGEEALFPGRFRFFGLPVGGRGTPEQEHGHGQGQGGHGRAREQGGAQARSVGHEPAAQHAYEVAQAVGARIEADEVAPVVPA